MRKTRGKQGKTAEALRLLHRRNPQVCVSERYAGLRRSLFFGLLCCLGTTEAEIAAELRAWAHRSAYGVYPIFAPSASAQMPERDLILEYQHVILSDIVLRTVFVYV